MTMTHIEYRLATTRRRDMVREAVERRRAAEASARSTRLLEARASTFLRRLSQSGGAPAAS
jgi:hypothetical protein